MQLRAWGATDVGKTRDHNEDSFLSDSEHKLFMVCDGMGGHAAGEIASSMAVQIIRDILLRNWDIVENYVSGKLPKTDVTRILEHAVQEACSAIYERAQKEPEKRGMGTTVDLLLIAGVRGFIAHVGDSRVYLVRQGQVHQLTEDHSVINYLIAKGRLKRSEVETSPYAKYKNAVTRAVGVYPNVEVDGIDFEILPGDKFLLCSDGLSFYLDEKNIIETFETEDLQQATSRFVDIANNGGGHDNISAVVVDILSEATAEHAQRAEDLRLRMDVLRQMPLFRHLEYKELVRVLNIAATQSYDPGSVIIQEGEPGEEMFVVLDGTIDLTKDGTYIVSFARGDHFGEMALVDRAPRSATAVAKDHVRVLTIHRKDFFQILRKEPKVAVKLLWSFVRVLTDRLRTTTESLSGAKLAVEAEDLSDEAVAIFDEPTVQPLNPWNSRGSIPSIPVVEPKTIHGAHPPAETDSMVHGNVDPGSVPTQVPQPQTVEAAVQETVRPSAAAAPERESSGVGTLSETKESSGLQNEETKDDRETDDEEVGDTIIEARAPRLAEMAQVPSRRRDPALMDTMPDQVSPLTAEDILQVADQTRPSSPAGSPEQSDDSGRNSTDTDASSQGRSPDKT